MDAFFQNENNKKEYFSDEDGIKAAELEAEFAEMDGWEADSNASKLMQGLGLDESIMYSQMADLGGNEKVKVLLAQALFGDPDIILLDALESASNRPFPQIPPQVQPLLYRPRPRNLLFRTTRLFLS